MELFFLIIFFIFCPALVMYLCKKVSFLGKIGAVLILYLIGIAVANSGVFSREYLAPVQQAFSNAMVPLSIPLLLFASKIDIKSLRPLSLALLSGIVAICGTVILGFFIFGSNIEDAAKIGGLMTGVYTGGTVNLASLKSMLGVNELEYVLLNSYDMLVSFLYLVFLLGIGIRLFRKFLPSNNISLSPNTQQGEIENNEQDEWDKFIRIFKKDSLPDIAKALGLTLLIGGISGGIAFILPENYFMTVFILTITTLSLLTAFFGKLKQTDNSYSLGMYFIYIFCLAVATMADITKLNFSTGLYLLGFLLFVVFVSLFVQILLAKILRIDADMVVISSVAFINSPPFVPMIAIAMKNPSVILPGISTGILGYAIGNYLGFLMCSLLGMF